MKGEIVWTFIYDTGGKVDLARVQEVVPHSLSFEPVQVRLAAPRSIDFPRPLSLRFPPIQRATSHGSRAFDVSARIYGIGAVALTIRTPVEAKDFGELRELGAMLVQGDAGGDERMESFARGFAAPLLAALQPALVEPYAVATPPEPYVVYCVTEPPAPADQLLHRERRALAALLANEVDPSRLAPEEVEDNLRHWYRYYEDDLVIVDWDYALVVEPTRKYEDVLFVAELANLQLLELRTYDAYLDRVLGSAYDDLGRFYKAGGIFRSARELQHTLSDARTDLIRVTEDINNIGKFFGDWYLAKLYVGLTERFHLREWEKVVADKLQALSDIYTMASHEVEHRRGVVLESMIVLLFVLDLVLIVMVY